MLIALRAIHILLGAFWAGTAIFFALFLEPSVRAAGQAGGAVMIQIMNRKYTQIIASAAGLTILSGFGLFGMDSTAAGPDWMHSRAAMSYSAGAAAAILALALGLAIIKPAGKRIVALMAAGNPPAAELNALYDRAQMGGRLVGALVTFAVLAMAVARYL